MTRIAATELFVRAGQTVKLRAFGHSMTPAIRSGEVLVVEAAPPEALVIGDVVLARDGRHLLAHRIARIAAGRVLLRDDQTGRDDGWFDASRVLGRVTAVERAGVRRPVAYRPLLLAGRRFAAQVRHGLRGLVARRG